MKPMILIHNFGEWTLLTFFEEERELITINLHCEIIHIP